MGQKIEALDGATLLREGAAGTIYQLQSVPLPNSEFATYDVVATKGHGVCQVTGQGRVYEGDPMAFHIGGIFEGLKESLASKYGKAMETRLIPALSDRPQTVVYSWSTKSGAALPKDIEAIYLFKNLEKPRLIDGTPSYDTSVRLGYDFANRPECVIESNVRNRDGL